VLIRDCSEYSCDEITAQVQVYFDFVGSGRAVLLNQWDVKLLGGCAVHLLLNYFGLMQIEIIVS